MTVGDFVQKVDSVDNDDALVKECASRVFIRPEAASAGAQVADNEMSKDWQDARRDRHGEQEETKARRSGLECPSNSSSADQVAHAGQGGYEASRDESSEEPS